MKNSFSLSLSTPVLYAADQVGLVAAALVGCAQEKSIIALYGDLGAGKTTLVRELCKAWEVQDPVSSPTYTYVNIYRADNGKRVYHFDLYRLQTVSDFYHAGFEEYLHDDNAVVVIEWPDCIADLLKTMPALSVHLSYHDQESRQIVIS